MWAILRKTMPQHRSEAVGMRDALRISGTRPPCQRSHPLSDPMDLSSESGNTHAPSQIWYKRPKCFFAPSQACAALVHTLSSPFVFSDIYVWYSSAMSTIMSTQDTLTPPRAELDAESSLDAFTSALPLASSSAGRISGKSWKHQKLATV